MSDLIADLADFARVLRDVTIGAVTFIALACGWFLGPVLFLWSAQVLLDAIYR